MRDDACVDANLLQTVFNLKYHLWSWSLVISLFIDAVAAVLLKALTFTSCVLRSFDIYCKKKINLILVMLMFTLLFLRMISQLEISKSLGEMTSQPWLERYSSLCVCVGVPLKEWVGFVLLRCVRCSPRQEQRFPW